MLIINAFFSFNFLEFYSFISKGMKLKIFNKKEKIKI